MKIIFFIFFILLVAIGLGFLVHQDPGLIMVTYDHWMVATSIWVGIATLIIAFCVLYFFVRLFKNIAAIPKKLSRRSALSHAQKYQLYMTQAISALNIGEFKRAEKYFSKAGNDTSSYVAYLSAAKAAQRQNQLSKRDAYIQKALSICNNDAKFVIALTQARLYLESEQWDEALPIFKTLYRQAPHNIFILTALKTIYTKTHDLPSLNFILPQLKKQKLISKEELVAMGVTA